MKKLGYLICLLLFTGCASPGKKTAGDSLVTATKAALAESIKGIRKKTLIAPYKLNEQYTVIDTGRYSDDGPMTGGTYAIITQNKVLIDTIDLFFGMKSIGGLSYLYQAVRSSQPDPSITTDKNLLWGTTGEYWAIENDHKTLFEKMVPDFDQNFSSPNVINGKIYFWQLKKLDSLGTLKVSASQYDIATHQLNSHYLFNDVLETDDTGYFGSPYLKNDTIYFAQDKKIKKFSKDFKPYN